MVKALEKTNRTPSTYFAFFKPSRARIPNKDKETFKPSMLGELVTEAPSLAFAYIIDEKYTRQLEEELERTKTGTGLA